MDKLLDGDPLSSFLVWGIGLWIRGKTLSCVLHTAAQNLELKAIDRESRLQKFLDIISPKITALQPSLSQADVLQTIRSQNLFQQQIQKISSRPSLYLGKYHRWAFGIMALEAIAHFTSYGISFSFMIFLKFLLAIGAFFCLILAQSQRQKSYHPLSLERITQWSLFYYFIIKNLTLVVVLSIIQTISLKNPAENSPEQQLFDFFSQISPQTNAPLFWTLMGDMIITLGLACMGYWFAHKWFSKFHRP